MGPLLVLRMQKVLSHIQEITIDDLVKMKESKKPFYLIDVREDSEWQRGFIPGATHLSKNILELHIEKLNDDPKAEMVLYCGGGTRSALAAESLNAMGYQNVKSLKGGLGAWQTQGLAVEVP